MLSATERTQRVEAEAQDQLEFWPDEQEEEATWWAFPVALAFVIGIGVVLFLI